MVEGGVCCSPGPSLRGIDGFDGMGRLSGGIDSPGSTNVAVVAVVTVVVVILGYLVEVSSRTS